ncbi:glycosyltransferase family 2 protein [Vibrio sp. 10N.222.49.C12]|uniref:glycosyltransferase family 2 protein n=1 Tax=Vibrio sp. 10N.222.49.C12 TaxID=3229614 RepID=UPI00354CABB4
MNDKKLVSVIVPVYNAASHLNEAVTSILNQTYTNIEVILINDGSTDLSLEICKDFKTADKRIHLIEQVNYGVSKARNVGLSKAKGEYVIFFDADDIVAENAIESLISMAFEYNSCDLVIGGYRTFSPLLDLPVKCKHYSSNDELVLAIIEGKTHAALWNKLIKRSAIEGISFNKDISYMEDKLFMLEVLQRELVVSYCDDLVYNYRVDDTCAPMLSSRSIESYFFVNDFILDKYGCKNNSKRIVRNYYRSLYFLILNCREYPFESSFKINYKLIRDIEFSKKLVLLLHKNRCFRLVKVVRLTKLLYCKLKSNNLFR